MVLSVFMLMQEDHEHEHEHEHEQGDMDMNMNTDMNKEGNFPLSFYHEPKKIKSKSC